MASHKIDEPKEMVRSYLIQTLERLRGDGVGWLPFKQDILEMHTTVSTNLSDQPTVKNDSIKKITDELTDCTRCRLCNDRQHVVIGRGNPQAELMFVGEAPGRDEDKQGYPFVGRAGKLLDKIIEAMGFQRDEIYIANIIKCRPPKNRNPMDDEIATCYPYLLRQIKVVSPKVICTLGSFAGQALLQTEEKISQLRGKFAEFEGIPLMPTYHPAFLLRNPSMKRVVWEDVQKISAMLNRAPVGKDA